MARPPRAPAFVLLLAAVLAACGWLLFAGQGQAAIVEPFGYPGEPAGAAGAPALGGGTSGVRPDELRGTVTVRLTPRARLVDDPAAPTFLLDLGAGPIASRPGMPIAGPMSVPGSGPVAGMHLVRWDLPGGAHVRLVDVPEPATAEPIVVTGHGRFVHAGTVVDEAGAPVAGAAVYLAGVVARTDERGVFTTPAVPGGHGLPFAVVADGHAALGRRLDILAANDDPAATRYVLAPEARAHVQLTAAAPRGGPAVHGVVLPARVGAPSAALLQFPFWLGALGDVEGVGDALRPAFVAGRAVFAHLPRDVALRFGVDHPELQAGFATDRSPGGMRPLSVVLPATALVPMTGRVVDEAGQPVAGALLRSGGLGADALVANPGPGNQALPPVAHVRGGALGWSDAQGRFHVGVPPGGAVVGVRAPGRVGQEIAVRPPPTGLPAHTFVLPARPDGAGPALALHLADLAGPHRLVVERHGAAEPVVLQSGVVAADGRVAQPLPEPMVVDVEVVRDGRVVWRETGVTVTGPVTREVVSHRDGTAGAGATGPRSPR